MSYLKDQAADPRAPVIAEGLFSFQIGGSERVGVDLAKGFAQRGYRVACFAFYDSEGPMRVELEHHGISCVDLDYSKRNRLTRRITYQWEFYRWLRRLEVKALHVHHATALTLCGIAAKLAGVPRVVMTEHALHQLKERRPYRMQAIRDCRYATGITAVHAGISDYFRDELHVPAQRLHVINNGVRITGRQQDKRSALRTQLGISQNTFAFLFAGRLELVKDLPTLLQAVALIPEPLRGSVQLLIAGDGSQRAVLSKTCADLGIESRVTFLGARTDVRDLMSAADGFVMSSITEGLPMALIEAMATDLPCVATAVGGIPELFANETGLLAPPSTPAELSAAMCRLVSETETQKRLVENGRRKVQSLYDLEGIVTEYLALLGLPARWPPLAK